MARKRGQDTKVGKAVAEKPARGRSRAARRRRNMAVGIAAAVVVAIVIGYFAYQAQANRPGVEFTDQGNLHIQTEAEPHVPYNSDPPTSGPHLPYIAPWGVHNVPIVRELQVHNLEDGGVVIQYNCPNGCADLVTQLEAIVKGYDRQVLLAPYPGMKTRIALTAWTRLDAFDEYDEGRIVRFIRTYRGIDHHKR
ncbi:MAG TPA: DUF3105 domain-containing protein [Verrucomicrobiae bacterium]|jgi:hypothetical protein|nr:DUF3105 domain-containing protein [Verrucomicrobiae bacterium]